MTCVAKDTFSNTVLRGNSLKSWNTTPICRRRYGARRAGMVATSWLLTTTWPELGTSSRKIILRNVVLPAPLGPVRNTNSPFSTCTLTSVSATAPWVYFLVT